jgi:hypothetical protein
MAERIFRELHQPEDSATAQESIEVMRAWVIDKHLQCTLSAAVFDDHAQWGVLLAELAQHISSAMHEIHGVDADATLKAIVSAFQKELVKSS